MPALAHTKEYEAMKKDETIKSADKEMVRLHSRQGCYQGCFSESKWGRLRRSQKWDLLVQCAPKLAQRHCEVPNSLRGILGISELKHTNGKYSKKVAGLHQCPEPLARALERVLEERMMLGEECTADFAANTLGALLTVWNQHVGELREAVREAASRELLQAQNAQITDQMSTAEVEALTDATRRSLENIVAELQPFSPSPEQKSFRTIALGFEILSADRFEFVRRHGA